MELVLRYRLNESTSLNILKEAINDGDIQYLWEEVGGLDNPDKIEIHEEEEANDTTD